MTDNPKKGKKSTDKAIKESYRRKHLERWEYRKPAPKEDQAPDTTQTEMRRKQEQNEGDK